MRILISGANGQLGKELTRILNTGFAEIGEIPCTLKNSDIMNTDVDNLDIANINDVLSFVENERPQVIINCSAFTNVDLCETDKDTAFNVNSLGPRNLAIAAQKVNTKLIHVSTDYVFSGDGNEPYCEYDICNPQSIYGKTKYLGEQYVKEFCSKYFIVRTSWLYGYEGNNFVKTIMNLAEQRESIKVVNDQRGNPTNANDLAYHILKLVDSNEYGIYHCTGNGECSWYDFACKIVEYANINCEVMPCTTEEFPRPAKRPSYSSLNNMMLKNTIGDKMRFWQDALKNFIKNYEGVNRIWKHI